MILIKPKIAHVYCCRRCGDALNPERILWQGIHVCSIAVCPSCNHEIIEDLPVGHSLYAPCSFDATDGQLLSESGFRNSWYSLAFANSLRHPDINSEITLSVEILRPCSSAIVLNCIDFLYGHALLKLLNAERHQADLHDHGLVVIIPPFLRWMVPSDVAEIWTVDISLSNARRYYPQLNYLVNKECERFERIYISRAFSHPKKFNLSKFTGIEQHNFDTDDYRITFVWREDRFWLDGIIWECVSRRVGLIRSIVLRIQNRKVTSLFTKLRSQFPQSIFTVAGLGRTTGFPQWIDDRRVSSYDNELTERQLCVIYAESRLVIGVHGSNMILPSGHAGMTIDLMPLDRWSNIAQDISFQEEDPRLASYRYRFIPVSTGYKLVSNIIADMVSGFNYFKTQMKNIVP